MDMTTLMAQIPDYGSDQALTILKNHSIIANKIGESFQTLWDNIIFDTNSSYWRAVVAGALDFSLLGILLFAWNAFKKDTDKLIQAAVEGAAMIVILAIMLGGNGFMTSNVLKVTRGFDINLTRTLAETQIIDITIADALKNVALSQDLQEDLNDLLAQCQNVSGQEGIECLQQQIPEVEAIVQAAEREDPIANSFIGQFGRGYLAYLQSLGANAINGDINAVVSQLGNTLVFGNPTWKFVINVIFGAVQLAFNFALEVASILHALLLPLVMGVVFTPVGPKYVETWIQGYVQLVLVKFLYVAVIGLVAQAIVYSESQFLTGTAFMVFSSVAGPALAFYMAKGGGAHLAKYVSSQVTSGISSVIEVGATAATGGTGGIGSALGKGLFKLGSKGLARRTARGK